MMLARNFVLLHLAVLACLVLAGCDGPDTDEPHDLIDNMMRMQYFTHKLTLSVDARNDKLADFYAHELEEIIEVAETIPTYHDHAIGELVSGMLVPAFEALEDAIEAGDWMQADARLDQMITNCNACHTSTGFDAIHIKRVESNPYLQSFEPAP